MGIRNRRVLVTGASGGIGAALAAELASRGARLCLTGRRADALEALADRLRADGAEVITVPADITGAVGRDTVLAAMQQAFGGIDVLVNNAGVSSFTVFEQHSPAELDALVALNVTAPLQLTRAVLPQMLTRGAGSIVNVGSMFGSIGFACFSAYSASKHALRGFSEALRRELEGTGVSVLYAAPRATRTAANSDRLYAMAAQTRMPIDAPEQVARRIADAMESGRKELFPGFAEGLLVRLNAVLPRLVDAALRKQNRAMQSFVHAPE